MNKLLEAFKVSGSSLKDAVDLYNEAKINKDTVNIYAQSLSTEEDVYTADDFLEELFGVIGYYYIQSNSNKASEPTKVKVTDNKEVIVESNNSRANNRYNKADIDVITNTYMNTMLAFKYIYGIRPLKHSYNEFKNVLQKKLNRDFKSIVTNTKPIEDIINSSPEITFDYEGVKADVILSSDIIYNFELALIKLGIKDTEILKLLEESIMNCRNHETLGIKHDMVITIINDSLTSSTDIGGVPRGISIIQRYILGVLPFYGSTAVLAFLKVLSGLVVISGDEDLLSDWIFSMTKYCKLMNYPAPKLNYGSIGHQLVLTACLLNDISFIFKDDMLASSIANYCGVTYKETLLEIQRKLNVTECEIISQVADRQSDIRKLMEISLSSVK